MTLVDTRTWVDFLHGNNTPAAMLLDGLLSRERIILGDLVWYELLRGFRRDADFKLADTALSPLECHPLVSPEIARDAVDHYRSLRNQHQITPDTTTMMLGSYCIRHQLPLLFSDPVFKVMATHLGLIDRSTLD